MESDILIKHNPETGHHLLNSHSVVLHCNHFNVELQNTLLLPEYVNGEAIQFQAAAEMAVSFLKTHFSNISNPGSEEIFETAQRYFNIMGLGLLDFGRLNKNGGIVNCLSSHYKLGWKIRFGKSEPQAHVLTRGYIAGVYSFTFQQPCSVELKSPDTDTTFIVTPTEHADYYQPSYPQPEAVELSGKPSMPRYATALPCEDITKEMAQGLPTAASNGLIEAFGVLLTYLPAEYYGKIAFRFEKELDKAGGIDGLAKPLLIESGHVCGFNTFGGIMTSDVWNTLIYPLLQTREDWVYAMIAVINALGWGHWRIETLEAGQKLILRVYNSTEAIIYRQFFGISQSCKCYTAEGAAAAIMNLIYKGDIMSHPTLDKSYYDAVFRNQHAFNSRETTCVAKGDPYCTFEFCNPE